MPPRPKPHHPHLLRLFALEKKVEATYLETIKAFALQHQLFSTHTPTDEPFTFDQLPRGLRGKVRGIIRELYFTLHTHISTSIGEAWEAAERNNDTLAIAHFGRKWHSLPPEVKDQYLTHNAPALDAFLTRKAQGLDLSQRVWQLSQDFKTEVELALQVGIAEGVDAEQLSRDLRQYLRQPERLFRRVRDEFGVLHLSKAAKAYKPGRGVYRSSFKNARRLAATETNIAYCTADHLRWQQLDFVVGIRIALSNNHTCLGRDGKPHRFTDICDELAGDYPKSFKFVGWHPHCRCIATPILKTPEELESDAPSSNEVKELPEGFHQWVEANRERIAAANERGTLPYFVRGNKEFFGLKRDKSDLFYFTPPKLMFRHPEPRKTPLEIAKERHAKRTKEQEEEIKKRWEERKKKLSSTSMLKTKYTTHEDVNETFKKINDSLPENEKWFRLGDLKLEYEYGEGLNGATYMNGVITLTPERSEHILSALGKIGSQKAKEITFDEADAMATFWHEITHNRHTAENPPLTRSQRYSMEMMNEFVARKTLPEFYKGLGVKDIPHPEFMDKRDSTGYDPMVVRFDYIVERFNLDKEKVLSSAKKNLFESSYGTQENTAIQALLDGGLKKYKRFVDGKPIGKKHVKALVRICQNCYPTSYLESYLKTSGIVDPST